MTLKYTPGWAVGYYSIPILFLWKPYQALKESYAAFTKKIGEERDSLEFPFWWGTWIVSGLIGRYLFKVSMNAEELNELIHVAKVSTGSSTFDILLDVLAILLVLAVSKACAKSFQKQNATTPPQQGTPLSGEVEG